jgi:nucleoside-diphosphate-sugar epimerase
MRKNVIVLGGGGFIGGHLAKKLKDSGHHVRVADIKNHEYFDHDEICHEFIKCDLTDPKAVELVIHENCDELYQLAADMGGAGYIFTGNNDANVMHNSALININVVSECVKKNVKKVFYSSSACMYPEHNQLDPLNPNCVESSAYPANPDSEYGWEKLFSERLYLAFSRNYSLNVRIARFHNIFGPQGTWIGGKEKAPAAMMRKVADSLDGDYIEVWGTGEQSRSFLYIDECIEAVMKFMNSEFSGPVNIGSEEMVTINDLARLAISISGKQLNIKNIYGEEFIRKYGFSCPLGVMGRNSNNNLFKEKIGWVVSASLEDGMRKTYPWILKELNKLRENS